ncbi:hypothetical protein C8R46DRAFT_1035006 [Mycena filopes]|nr:hypothetical protein C8R46DRAFT_1035006 [Mycena filopes]
MASTTVRRPVTIPFPVSSRALGANTFLFECISAPQLTSRFSLVAALTLLDYLTTVSLLFVQLTLSTNPILNHRSVPLDFNVLNLSVVGAGPGGYHDMGSAPKTGSFNTVKWVGCCRDKSEVLGEVLQYIIAGRNARCKVISINGQLARGGDAVTLPPTWDSFNTVKWDLNHSIPRDPLIHGPSGLALLAPCFQLEPPSHQHMNEPLRTWAGSYAHMNKFHSPKNCTLLFGAGIVKSEPHRTSSEHGREAT